MISPIQYVNSLYSLSVIVSEAPQPHPKEAKERKFLRRLSNKTHNGPTAGRKESKSPDVTSSPKKTKKKLKIVI